MSRRYKRQIIIVFASAILLGLIGLAYSFIFKRSPVGSFFAGFFAGGSIMAFEWFVVQRKSGEWLRRGPLLRYALISAGVWALISFFWIRLNQHLFYPESEIPELFSVLTFRALAVAISCLAIFNFVLRLGQLIGARVMLNFFLGRYYNPQEENRIFMFLDLANSVQMTEKLGPLRMHSLISHFFFDVAGIVTEHGGETHRYIGDEAVVTWPQRKGIKGAAWLKCIIAIRDHAIHMDSYYLKNFGMKIRFRAGLHCGSVVAGEVGDNKREIVYFGDTVNTAARIEACCKEKGEPILISSDLVNATVIPPDVELESIGPVLLRGRGSEMEMYKIVSDRN